MSEPSNKRRWFGRGRCLAVFLIAVALVPVGDACCDDVQIKRLWYRNIKSVKFVKGQIHFRVAAAPKLIKYELRHVDNFKITDHPGFIEAEEAFEDENYNLAYRRYANLRSQLDAGARPGAPGAVWIRQWIDHRMVKCADRMGTPVPALNAYIRLIYSDADDFFLKDRFPEASLNQLRPQQLDQLIVAVRRFNESLAAAEAAKRKKQTEAAKLPKKNPGKPPKPAKKDPAKQGPAVKESSAQEPAKEDPSEEPNEERSCQADGQLGDRQPEATEGSIPPFDSSAKQASARKLKAIGIRLALKILPKPRRPAVKKDPLRVAFFGIEDKAQKIAYVVDASGSMMGRLPFAVSGIKMSINQLDEKQQFAVVFFKSSAAIKIPGGLQQATLKNKIAAMRWLASFRGEIIPGGGSNPIAAIESAMEYQPDVMFVLSDNLGGCGRFEVDQRSLIFAVRKITNFKTRINTIQFIEPDRFSQFGLRSTLKRMAQEHRGEYRFVAKGDLGIEIKSAELPRCRLFILP
jgi:hypothetical protein